MTATTEYRNESPGPYDPVHYSAEAYAGPGPHWFIPSELKELEQFYLIDRRERIKKDLAGALTVFLLGIGNRELRALIGDEAGHARLLDVKLKLNIMQAL